MDKKKKRIYIGLPQALVKKVQWVKKDYRTILLSHRPGGSDVIIEYHNGTVAGYDWIKYPARFFQKLLSKNLSNQFEAFNSLSKTDQLELTRKSVNKVFARNYIDETGYLEASFKEVWNSITSTKFPWDALLPYDVGYIESRNAPTVIPLNSLKYFNSFDHLEFDVVDGVPMCVTPIGIIHRSEEIDHSKPQHILLDDNGKMWLSNIDED